MMDKEVEDIKRRAGMLNEFGYPPERKAKDPSMEQMRRLVAGAAQALDAGDAGRAKAILRDLYRLTGGTDEGY